MGARACLLLACLALTACGGGGGGGGGGSATESRSKSAVEPGAAPGNRPPAISGSAPSQVTVGRRYRFKPKATDPDNDALSFGIQNRPPWATFNSANGRLVGRPQPDDVGEYNDIRISVTDGEKTTGLEAFSITVSLKTRKLTVRWKKPVKNTNGSPLVDLAGYRIYMGTRSDRYSTIVLIDNPAKTRYVFEGLAPGRYYFALTAMDRFGIESEPTPELTVAL